MVIHYIKGKIFLPLAILSMATLMANDLDIVVGEPNTDKFPEICFTISVKDSLGNKITDLDTSMIRLYEDSVKNQNLSITTLGDRDDQIAILIAVDASLSMAGEPIDSVKASIKAFLGQSSNNDHIGIIAFHDSVEIISPFTSDMVTLSGYVDSIKAVGSDTYLHMALYKGLEMLQENDSLPSNKALIVLSDGKDEGMAYSDDDAIELALKFGIPIYSIGYHTKVAKKHLRVLERMSDKTGGEYIDAPTTADLAGVYDAVYEQIQAQQTVCFSAQAFKADSLEHVININLVTESGNGNSSIVFRTPAGDGKKLDWILIASVILLLVGVSFYMNRKAKQQAEEEKKQLQDEKERLEKELSLEREARSQGDQPVQDKTELADREPDPRHTVISGSTGAQGYQAQFYFDSGPLSGQTVILSDGMTIGRSESNTLVIADQTVSGQHGKIEYKGNNFVIVDLNSTNGTLVNGNKISEIALKQGDRVELGKVKITVK